MVWLDLSGYAVSYQRILLVSFQTGGHDPGRLVLPEEESDLPGTQLQLRRFCAANKGQTFRNR